MEKRIAGRVGVGWSEVGLGCWQLGGDCWGDLDEARGEAILETAIRGGVNFFDTADVYGDGRSEALLGKVLGASDAFIATKLGRREGFPGPYSLETFERAVARSSELLRRDRLDLIQLHCVPPAVLEAGEVFGWLRKLQERGKIAAFGASIESVDEGLRCLQEPDLVSLQVIFNVLRQKPAERLLGEAAEKGVAIIVRLPLASGLLSGRYSSKTTFSANDHRTFNRDGAAFHVGETFNGLPYDKALSAVEAVRPHVPEGWGMAEFALRWILDHPAVTTIIPGASRPEQVHGNLAAADRPPLSAELHEELKRVYGAVAAPFIRGSY